MADRLQDVLGPLGGSVPLQALPRHLAQHIEAFRPTGLEAVLRLAIFGAPPECTQARWLLWNLAAELGIYPASLHDLYAARGRGEVAPDFTVPAVNLRMLPYDLAAVVFQVAQARQAGAFVLELARSEMAYTDQSPSEVMACVLAGAIEAGYQGPVFVQADHVKLFPAAYAYDPDAELAAVHDLARAAIHAGFYNLDLDTSTLVEPDHAEADRQQYPSYIQAAALAAYLRAHEPASMPLAIGGEIGDDSPANSTEAELRAFLEGFLGCLPEGLAGLSKIAIQTGAVTGGVILAGGQVASVALDFVTLLRLSQVAREYGLAGAVQHGASTLPPSAYDKFIQSETCEIHLATDFQNTLFEHQAFPAELRRAMYTYLDTHFADRRVPGQTIGQFYYRERRRAIGPFKRELWALDGDVRRYIRETWWQRVDFLFEQLNVSGTHALAVRYAPQGPRPRPLGDFEPSAAEATSAEDAP